MSRPTDYSLYAVGMKSNLRCSCKRRGTQVRWKVN